MGKLIKNTNELIQRMRGQLTARTDALTDDQVRSQIEETVLKDPAWEERGVKELKQVVDRVFYALRSDLDILQPWMDDPTVSEIMVNGQDHIFVERSGQIEAIPDRFYRREDLEEVIRRLAARVHREINERHPIVDARMENGSRVNAVYRNVALGGPVLTIRKFPETGLSMEDLIRLGTLTEECGAFLSHLVATGYNCFVSGGTSSGKTTLLNVLSQWIPRDERVIVIEDSAELQLRGIDNLVRMECRGANGEGGARVEMDQLIRTSLRMRPDRIIVGEVRGKEVVDMIQAMNTGHDGSLSTGHGNSVQGMLHRLEVMFLQAVDFPIEAIRSQICEGIDVIIHLARLPDGSRKVMEVAELSGRSRDGGIQTNPLYCYEEGKGLFPTGNGLKNDEKKKRRQEANAHRL